MSKDTPPDRAELSTEQRHPRTTRLHRLSVPDLVAVMERETNAVQRALTAARPALIRLIAAAEPGFRRGGRLIYCGAGTSGRLGVLDASEAPPTFCVDEGRVVGLIAGGDRSLRRSSEGAEDDPRGALPALRALRLTRDDTLIGIAAGGTTPYVLGALAVFGARRAPAGLRRGRPLTALLCCADVGRPPGADHLVVLKTGPEVLTGSTRLKAGTATKLALNTLSTVLMTRSGRVYSNLMVDVRATNAKLRDRAARIVAALTGLERDAAFAALAAAQGSAKLAVAMQRLGLDRDAARAALGRVAGDLAALLDAPQRG